jgi:hypothetical protein
MGRALSMKAAMLEDARLSSAIKRSNAAGREQTTARILLHGPTVGRLRSQPSRSAPSLPRPERAGREPRCPKASTPGRASQLDPLKIANGDPRLPPVPTPMRCHRPGRLPGRICPVVCRRLIAPHDHINVERIELDATADAAGLVDCDEGRAGAGGTGQWPPSRHRSCPM